MASGDGPRLVWEHVLPFLAWVVVMSLPLGAPAVRYAAQSAIGLAFFLWLRPWRHYAGPAVRRLPAAFSLGVVVFALWVLPESAVADRLPGLRELYLRYGVRPLGVVPRPVTGSPFAPEQCGWPLTLVRLAASAFVIAVIEEFFWRGFLLRWLSARNFLNTDPGLVRWPVFAVVAALFALEHDRWLAGLLAGLAYGLLYVRTKDLWATAGAHVVTNLLLGLYVLATSQYGFW